MSEEASIDGFSEYYVCAEGYAGLYDVLIRRVYGEVSGGKVTVEVFTDFGTENQSHFIEQIELDEDGAMVQVAVREGHRAQPIATAQLANVREQQLATGRAVLGQFAGGDFDSSSAQDYFNLRNTIANNRRFGFPVGGGAVGYRPVITTLNEGCEPVRNRCCIRGTVATFEFRLHHSSPALARFSLSTSLTVILAAAVKATAASAAVQELVVEQAAAASVSKARIPASQHGPALKKRTQRASPQQRPFFRVDY